MGVIDYRQVAEENKRRQLWPFVLLFSLIFSIVFLVWYAYTGILKWDNKAKFSEIFKNIQSTDQGLSQANNQNLAIQYNNQGIKYLKTEDYLKAKTEFEKAIQVDPKNYRPYHNLGIVYASLDDWKNSIESYILAINLKPDFEPAKVNLIGAYKSAGNCVKSKTEAITFLEKYPISEYNRQVRWMLADAHSCLYEYTEALKELLDVLSSKSESEDLYRVYNDIAFAYCSLGQIEQGLGYGIKSIELLESQTIKNLPTEQRSMPYLTMGNCYYRTGKDDDKAIIYFKKALELQPILAEQYKDLFRNLGIVK